MAYRKTQFTAPQYWCKDGRKCMVSWENRDHYCGPWDGRGSPAPAVLQKYLRLVVQFEQEYQARSLGMEPLPAEHDLTIAEAVLWYLKWLEVTPHPEGALRADGTKNGFFKKAKWCTRPLVELYGDTLAARFSAKDLRTLRKAMLGNNWRTKPGKPWGINYVNEACYHVQKLFGWLESEEHIPPGKAQHLGTIGRLTAPRRSEPETVPDVELELVIANASPIVAAMLRLQRLTACRPGELCVMRPIDLDKSLPVWVYRPGSHKTAWKGKDRAIPLGTVAQEVLRPLLEGREQTNYVFSPRESAEWWRTHRTQKPPEELRTTPIYPSEVRRREKAKRQRRKAGDRRRFSARFTADTYAQAVERAQAKARASHPDTPIGKWTPYAVRHTRITEVQNEMGWEDAQAVAGHDHLNTTKLYSHQRLARALRIAAEAQQPNHPIGAAGEDKPPPAG